MIFFEEGIWEPCSKEEFEESLKDYSLFSSYRKVPIYKSVEGGIWDQINNREPQGYNYEKLVGTRQCVALSSREINDKKLISFLKGID